MSTIEDDGALEEKSAELTSQIGPLRAEAAEVQKQIGAAMVDDPKKAEALRKKRRSLLDQADSAEAGVAEIARRRRAMAHEVDVVRRAGHAEDAYRLAGEYRDAVAAADEAIDTFCTAIERLRAIGVRGQTAAKRAEGKGREAHPLPFSRVFRAGDRVGYSIAHALMKRSPEVATMLGVRPTAPKQITLTESLSGFDGEFRAEAWADALREVVAALPPPRARPDGEQTQVTSEAG